MVVLLRFLLPVAFFAFWIWAVVDVIRTDEGAIDYLAKVVWLLLVLFFPLVGAIAWLILGRSPSVPRRRIPMRRRPALEVPPAEEPSDYRLSEEAREEAIRRYYEEKRRRDEQQWLEEQFRRPDAEPPDAPRGG